LVGRKTYEEFEATVKPLLSEPSGKPH